MKCLQAGGQMRRVTPYFIPRILINMAAGAVSKHFGLRGPVHCATTACASGAHSVGDAYRMIKWGDADRMVAGGTEACVDAVLITLSPLKGSTLRGCELSLIRCEMTL
jgi:3-oxoacyl-[acyl-carrier-protein] synthase II